MLNSKLWGTMGPTVIYTKPLSTRAKADPAVYKKYRYIDKRSVLSPEDEVEILLRKNGKVAKYEHPGKWPSVGGHLVVYHKGDLIETTLEHCIENINSGRSSFRWMNAITIDALAKEANVHPEVLIAIIMSRYVNSRIYKLMMGLAVD
jgi:hypothetical protein